MNKKFKTLTYIAAAALFFSSCSKPLEVPTPTPLTSTGSTGSSSGSTGTGGKTGTTGTTGTTGSAGATGTTGSTGSIGTVTPPTGNIINVGDGKSALTIDGKTKSYPAGSVIVIKSGTYLGAITVRNLTGVTVQGTGVILDGLNKSQAGQFNSLALGNLTNVTISGITVQNSSYRAVNIDARLSGVTLTQMTYSNCESGIMGVGDQTIWDKTDNTVFLLNFTISNSTFNNVGPSMLGPYSGGITNGNVYSLVKNLTISGNKFSNSDAGDLLQCEAVDNFQIFNNTVTNINPTNNGDNRLFMMIGYGDAYNNTFTNYEGHAIGIWPISFGTTVKTSHIHNNTCKNSRRYSAFEYQEFTELAIPGTTVKSDLIVDSNVASSINTDHWTGYPGTFIDNYMFGYVGGHVTLTNNKGYNFYPAPLLGILWNLAAPFLASGNTYSSTAL